MTTTAQQLDSLVAPAPVAPVLAAAPRRLPLRATGLLAILGVMLLAMLLVAAALVFRGAVVGHLDAAEQADARWAAALQLRAQEAMGNGEGLREIDQQLRRIGAERAAHLAESRRLVDGGTVVMACIAWLGITCIGALALLFFSRLANDIGAVRARALAILTGDRSRSSSLERNDELSDLAQALDSLAEALGRRERDLDIQRRQVMHQEKLAAIGSMAAGVLREIGNPIAAIDGLARALVEGQHDGDSAPAAASWIDPAQILHETARLAAITHEISELAATPTSQWQLASLNEVVAKSLALLRYEPRLEGVAVIPLLDPQLPAVMGIADRLVQVVMNLVVNAADAVASLPPRTGSIEVTTRRAGAGLELCVRDNGSGMSEPVRERAFEPLFTTKPAGCGTGLGLPLCRSVVQEHGGRIDLDSAPGEGTRVRVWLPAGAGPAVQ